MTVYSPSQTKDYHECPMMWALTHIDKYEPREFTNFELSGALGSGIGAGLAAMYSRNGADPIMVGAEAAQAAIDELLAHGKCRPRDVETMKRVGDRVVRAMGKLVEAPPLPDDWTVEGIEMTFPDHGYCRVDALVRDPHRLATLDWKAKLTLDKKKEARVLSGDEWWWATNHYTWAASEAMGEEVWRHHTYLVIVEPKCRVEPIPYTVDPVERRLWLRSAQQTWQDMDACIAGERFPWAGADCLDWFSGGCKMGCKEHFCEEAGLKRKFKRRGE